MELVNAVKQVYKGREQMILLGLTGRTGSGCTKVAEILQTEEFFKLDLKDSKSQGYKNSDERKYKIITDFMKEPRRWKGFQVIEISSIILAAALEKEPLEFKAYLNRITDEKGQIIINIGEKDKLLKSLDEIDYMFKEAKKYSLNIDLSNKNDETINYQEYCNFYLNEIKRFKKNFKDLLADYTCFQVHRNKINGKQQNRYHLYTYLMQQMGNNLRSSGNPFENNFSEEKFREFFKRVDNLIDIIKRYTEKTENDSVRICIDAIRNPYEALYFKDKYKAFHLLAISTEDQDRRERLRYLNREELDSLDKVEYPSKLANPQEVFYHQNIQGCLEIADIHVYNKNVTNKRFYDLTEQLVKYISLMIHPGLVTPTHIERCMQLAYNAKYNSGCLSRQVGAVVTREDFSIQSIGWNDVPKGQVSCNLRDISSFCQNKDCETYSQYELEDSRFDAALRTLDDRMREKAQGRCKAYCFKDVYNGLTGEKNQVYTRSLHAEENAFLQISKYGGTKVKNGCLFTTASPCELCAKKAYQLGIRNIYYIDPYPGISQKHILSFGKSDNPKMQLFYGAIGTAYLEFYENRIPIKDELEMLTGINVKEVVSGKEKNPVLKYEDVQYTKVMNELKFVGNRNVVESIRTVGLQLKRDGIEKIPKKLIWTGSSYEGTKLLKEGTSADIRLEEQKEQMPYSYDIIFTKEKKAGDVAHYKVLTTAKDEKHVMEPYLAHMVTHQTDSLEIKVAAPEGLVKNVRKVIYADLEMQLKVKEEDVEPSTSVEATISDANIVEYSFQPDVVNVNYTYAIEWEF